MFRFILIGVYVLTYKVMVIYKSCTKFANLDAKACFPNALFVKDMASQTLQVRI